MKHIQYNIYLIFIFATGLFLPYNVCGQESQKITDSCFYYLQNEATSDFRAAFPKIFVAYVKEQTPEYQSIIRNIKDKDWKNAYDGLYELISQDNLVNEIKCDSRLILLHSQPEWLDILNKIDSIQSGEYTNLKHDLYEIQQEDQSIRLLLLESYKKYGIDSQMSQNIRTYMDSIDNLNSIKIQSIIDRYGWLGKDKLGENGNETLFLCIQHCDDLALQNKYLPILKKAVENGNAEPWHYAFLADRILMNKGEKQIYGTQKIISKIASESYIVPLKDPDNVDKLRAEIGLEPLSESLKEEGIDWNLEEYKKNLPTIEEKYKKRNSK